MYARALHRGRTQEIRTPTLICRNAAKVLQSAPQLLCSLRPCCIAALLLCCFAALLLCCFAALLHCCSAAALLICCSAALLHCCTAAALLFIYNADALRLCCVNVHAIADTRTYGSVRAHMRIIGILPWTHAHCTEDTRKRYSRRH
jgi:hypothetical protein